MFDFRNKTHTSIVACVGAGLHLRWSLQNRGSSEELQQGCGPVFDQNSQPSRITVDVAQSRSSVDILLRVLKLTLIRSGRTAEVQHGAPARCHQAVQTVRRNKNPCGSQYKLVLHTITALTRRLELPHTPVKTWRVVYFVPLSQGDLLSCITLSQSSLFRLLREDVQWRARIPLLFPAILPHWRLKESRYTLKLENGQILDYLPHLILQCGGT